MKNCNIIIFFSIIFFLFGCEVADPQIIGEPPIIDSPYTIDEPYDFRTITEVPGFLLPTSEGTDRSFTITGGHFNKNDNPGSYGDLFKLSKVF